MINDIFPSLNNNSGIVMKNANIESNAPFNGLRFNPSSSAKIFVYSYPITKQK